MKIVHAYHLRVPLWALLCASLAGCSMVTKEQPMIPQIVGSAWTVAHNPDLGEFNSRRQEPVDFAVWQAVDGTWQLWSCIRNTKCSGHTRLFYHWEGKKLTDPDWKPLGIAMTADARYGEMPGGLQAPYVTKVDDTYYMLYGSWINICLATSQDGKNFTRELNKDGQAGLFNQGPQAVTRDPMALKIGDLWYGYYTANPDGQGAVYCRTSPDLRHWSNFKIVAFGGQTGIGANSAECPFVVRHNGYFYLFRTQNYGTRSKTSVYRSKDPLDFGRDNDRYLIETLPISAPEIVVHQNQFYVAHLRHDLKGIQINRLTWVPD